jgi:hypothetical protein
MCNSKLLQHEVGSLLDLSLIIFLSNDSLREQNMHINFYFKLGKTGMETCNN